ncbi:MAG: hypothetical protein PHZ19_01660 [Candidatus Thermoplasmatota archaeon]|nr:hypothetical protein [Candidatus Thermoplasmatota archaeon]
MAKRKKTVKVRGHNRGDLEIASLKEMAEGKPFVKYPTQVKAHKRRKPRR